MELTNFISLAINSAILERNYNTLHVMNLLLFDPIANQTGNEIDRASTASSFRNCDYASRKLRYVLNARSE